MSILDNIESEEEIFDFYSVVKNELTHAIANLSYIKTGLDEEKSRDIEYVRDELTRIRFCLERIQMNKKSGEE